MTPPVLGDRVANLRDAFDRAFAQAPTRERERTEDALLVRVAGHALAIRASESAGLVKARSVVPVPSRRPEFLGVSGLRGALLCVYSLAALLGQKARPLTSPWLLLCGGADPVGLALEELEGFARVATGLWHDEDRSSATELVRGVLHVAPAPRPILDLRLVVEKIRSAGPPGSTRSRP